MGDNDGDLPAAAYLEIRVWLVQAAVASFVQHQAEIGKWIELNQQTAEAHEASPSPATRRTMD